MLLTNKKTQRLFFKLFGAFFASISLPISIILMTPMLLGQFGIESVAKYHLIFFSLNILMVFFQGLFTTIIKEMSSEATVRIIRFTIVERFMLPTIFIVVSFLFLLEQIHYLIAVSLLALYFYSAVLVGLGGQFIQGTILGAVHLIFVLLVYIFSSALDDFEHIILLYFSTILVGTVLLRIVVSQKFKQLPSSISVAKTDWGETIKLSLTEGIGIISSITDRTAIYLLLQTPVFGIYSLATTVGKSTSFLRTPLLRVFTPYLLNNQGDLARKTVLTSIILCSLIMPILTFLSVYCAWIFELWIGPQSNQTILTTQIILVGTAFHTSATPFYYSLISLNKTNSLMRLSLFVLIFSLFGCLLGAFWFGMIVVASIWVLSNIINFFACYIMLINSLKNPQLVKQTSILIFFLTALPILPLLILSTGNR